MLSKPIHALRYPQGSDTPDVPFYMEFLAADLEAELGTRVAAAAIGEVGQVGQRRAGRILTVTDFTDLGLAAPAVLYNLSDLTDVSGAGRNLSNKGAVPFGVGILGGAGGGAVFSGSTAQALYRADEAATSIRAGSFGCWFKTAKRGTGQDILTKWRGTGEQRSYVLGLDAANKVYGSVYTAGTAVSVINATGTADVCDDRWHFAVVTYDGMALRVYLDGALEVVTLGAGLVFDGSAPLNVGASDADAGVAASNPFYGRADEAFVTPEVLTEDQIRCLMACKIAHGATRSPRRVNLNVRRYRRGPVLAQADFTALGLAAPLRLYNLDGLADLGSAGIALTAGGGVTAGSAPGPDGKAGGATIFDGVDDVLSTANTGLPAGTAARTIIAWFKTLNLPAAAGSIIAYGNDGANMRIRTLPSGVIGIGDGVNSVDGPFVADGLWHCAVAVIDGAAADGLKQKLYLDGRLVASSTALNATTVGAGLFIGRNAGSAVQFFNGHIARAVVTGYTMTPEQIAAIYNKGSQDLGLSPFAPGEYVERLDATNVLLLADRVLEPQEQVELEVAS